MKGIGNICVGLPSTRSGEWSNTVRRIQTRQPTKVKAATDGGVTPRFFMRAQDVSEYAGVRHAHGVDGRDVSRQAFLDRSVWIEVL